METSLLGHRVPFPIGIAPTAFLRLAHPDGEVAAARGEYSQHDDRVFE